MSFFSSFLLNLPRYGDIGKKAMNPGMERVEALVSEMGFPHRRFRSIHIAGTNGKGSTASMLTSILRSAGLERVGLYTSPHLLSMRERIRCDGKSVPVSWMNSAVRRFQLLMDEVQPSFFEAMTALAFLYFAEQDVSYAVVEAGLGGRLDATNILFPELSIITGIDYDHTNILGTTLPAIAREKAGIIKPRIPCLTATHQPEALSVIESVALRQHAPLYVTHRACTSAYQEGENGAALNLQTPCFSYADLTLALAGKHQSVNASLAIRASELLGHASEVSVRRGLQDVHALSGLRGRLETISTSPLIILDVAHNLASIRAALRHVRGHRPQRIFVLLGLVRSKDAESIAQELFRSRAFVYACEIPARRGLPPKRLAETLRSWSVPVPMTGTLEQSFSHVMKRVAEADAVLICGSHYLAGDFLKVLIQ